MSRRPKNKKFIEAPMQRRRAVTRREAELWASFTDEIKPLPGRIVDVDAAPVVAQEPRPSPEPKPIESPLRRVKPDLDQRGQDPLSHGIAPGVDQRTLNRLRQGKMEIESRLDLHGMTQRQAQDALLRFISSAYHRQQRCVLVITGRGLRESGEIGILRQSVPNWLNQVPLRSMILAFTYAARDHGGEGALFILLKRHRN